MSIRTVRPLLPRPRLIPTDLAEGAGAGQGPPAPAGSARRTLSLVTAFLLAPIFGGICLFPAWLPLRNPTIFYDDVVRVAELQQYGFSRNLFVPINEHMQPFFQAVTGVAWQATGGRLVNLPAALAIASTIPFALSLILLAVLVHRSLGSWSAALLAAAVFGFGSRSCYETVAWYSASSFQWALAWTLAALIGATLAGSRGAGRFRRLGGWSLAMLCSAVAPACCGVGLLAGPAAGTWALGQARGYWSWRRWARAAIPMLGTAAFLAVCLALRYQDHLSATMERNPYYPPGLLNVYRAPIVVLPTAVVGSGNIDDYLPDAAELGLFAAGLAALAWCARRSPTPQLYLVGGLLIVANYLLIYGSRHLPGDDHWVLKVERYHLFPQLGLTLILAPAVAAVLRPLDRRPAAAMAMVTAASLILLALHERPLRSLAQFYRFGDQQRTLAALDRLAEICRQKRIPREAAVQALDPVRRRWFPADMRSVIGMIPETASGPSTIGDGARPLILAALAPDDREALCGGMDVSPYLRPAASMADAPASTTDGVLTGLTGITRLDAGTYRSTTQGSFLEYQFEPAKTPPRAIALRVDTTQLHSPLTISWTDNPRGWSALHSVSWRSPASDPRAAAVLPLESLPHWNKARITRIRIIVGEAGALAVDTPKLIR